MPLCRGPHLGQNEEKEQNVEKNIERERGGKKEKERDREQNEREPLPSKSIIRTDGLEEVSEDWKMKRLIKSY